MNRVEPDGWDEVEVVYQRMATDLYRIAVRREEEDGDEGTAGVREPRRPKPLFPVTSLEIVIH